MKTFEITQTLSFTEFDYIKAQEVSFRNSELGKFKELFPFEEIAKLLAVKKRKASSSRPETFHPEAQIGLMILKARYNISDRDLLERLNTDMHFQLFCRIFISPTAPLNNYKIISRIRTILSSKLGENTMLKFQKIIASSIKPHISKNDLKVVMSDATCYESNMRFPTDAKLLWESVERIHKLIKKQCQQYKIKQPRTKYIDVSDAYLSYAKTRKKGYKKSRKIVARLIKLLSKLLSEYELIKKTHKIKHSKQISSYYSVIKKIYLQQVDHFAGKKIEGRIVSIDKPYIRPIVRGKETKAVEFGAKVNAIQVGGYNFIEHISFNAFNEGIRVRECIDTHKILFHCKPQYFAGDAIYATNKNRVYCRENHILTNFVPKGRPASDEAQRKIMRRALNIARATTLEGSFGTEKQHYSLRKICARTKRNEILWLLFGIHTANFSRLVRSLTKQEQLMKQAV